MCLSLELALVEAIMKGGVCGKVRVMAQSWALVWGRVRGQAKGARLRWRRIAVPLELRVLIEWKHEGRGFGKR